MGPTLNYWYNSSKRNLYPSNWINLLLQTAFTRVSYIECCIVLCQLLSLLFKLSINLSRLPLDRKTARIILIFKRGRKDLAWNYQHPTPPLYDVSHNMGPTLITDAIVSKRNLYPSNWINLLLQTAFTRVSYIECCIVLCQLLSLLFKLSINLSRLPLDRKTARIIPIFKRGTKDLVGNYQPIRMTSAVVKVLERILFFDYIC